MDLSQFEFVKKAPEKIQAEPKVQADFKFQRFKSSDEKVGKFRFSTEKWKEFNLDANAINVLTNNEGVFIAVVANENGISLKKTARLKGETSAKNKTFKLVLLEDALGIDKDTDVLDFKLEQVGEYIDIKGIKVYKLLKIIQKSEVKEAKKTEVEPKVEPETDLSVHLTQEEVEAPSPKDLVDNNF